MFGRVPRIITIAQQNPRLLAIAWAYMNNTFFFVCLQHNLQERIKAIHKHFPKALTVE